MQKEWFEANRQGWNLRTPVHRSSKFYDVAGWLEGKSSLNPLELELMGEVSGLKLLHLQCHFGQDTLSWARLGARVTGCDLSDEAISEAGRLARQANLKARFVRCNVYDLPQVLKGKFDRVIVSYGCLGWLPDLHKWAQVVSHFLKRGGRLVLVEFHPLVWMFDDNFEKIEYAYHNQGPIVSDNQGTYTDREAPIQYREYGWNHGLSEVIESLLGAGLRLESVREHSGSPYPCFRKSVLGSDGLYRIEGLEDKIPLLYSLRMSKP